MSRRTILNTQAVTVMDATPMEYTNSDDEEDEYFPIAQRPNSPTEQIYVSIESENQFTPPIEWNEPTALPPSNGETELLQITVPHWQGIINPTWHSIDKELRENWKKLHKDCSEYITTHRNKHSNMRHREQDMLKLQKDRIEAQVEINKKNLKLISQQKTNCESNIASLITEVTTIARKYPFAYPLANGSADTKLKKINVELKDVSKLSDHDAKRISKEIRIQLFDIRTIENDEKFKKNNALTEGNIEQNNHKVSVDSHSFIIDIDDIEWTNIQATKGNCTGFALTFTKATIALDRISEILNFTFLSDNITMMNLSHQILKDRCFSCTIEIIASRIDTKFTQYMYKLLHETYESEIRERIVDVQDCESHRQMSIRARLAIQAQIQLQ